MLRRRSTTTTTVGTAIRHSEVVVHWTVRSGARHASPRRTFEHIGAIYSKSSTSSTIGADRTRSWCGSSVSPSSCTATLNLPEWVAHAYASWIAWYSFHLDEAPELRFRRNQRGTDRHDRTCGRPRCNHARSALPGAWFRNVSAVVASRGSRVRTEHHLGLVLRIATPSGTPVQRVERF